MPRVRRGYSHRRAQPRPGTARGVHHRHAHGGAPPRHSRAASAPPLTSRSPTSTETATHPPTCSPDSGSKRLSRLCARLAALCAAQRPARASRRSPAPSAAAGSRVPSQPCTRRSYQLTPRVAALCSVRLSTHAPRHGRVLGGSCRVAASCRARQPAHVSRHGCRLYPASQPRARRGWRLMRRVVALRSTRLLAHASRRNLKIGAAAGQRRIAAVCSARLPARAKHAHDGDLPAPPLHSRAHALSPHVSVTHLSSSRYSLVLSAAAGSRIAAQPGARRSRWLMHRVAALCSAQLHKHDGGNVVVCWRGC